METDESKSCPELITRPPLDGYSISPATDSNKSNTNPKKASPAQTDTLFRLGAYGMTVYGLVWDFDFVVLHRVSLPKGSTTSWILSGCQTSGHEVSSSLNPSISLSISPSLFLSVSPSLHLSFSLFVTPSLCHSLSHSPHHPLPCSRFSATPPPGGYCPEQVYSSMTQNKNNGILK